MTGRLTAAEARRIVDEVNDINGPHGQHDTDIALGLIKAAAERSQTSCMLSVNEKYRVIVTKRLQALGFKVEFQDNQRDGGFVTVSW